MRQNEHGSALMLVPAGVLVLIVLAAIAIDSSIAFMAQRELLNAAAGAANDAATAAIATDDLQSAELAEPNQLAADQIVQQRLSSVSGAHVTSVETVVNGDVVTVTAEATVPYIFAKAIPGASHEARVSATSSAQVRFRGS